MSTDREFGFHTRSVHAGARPEPTTGARALPIYQTTSYVFEDPESAAAYFNLQEYGNTYSRIMNPTVAALEERTSSSIRQRSSWVDMAPASGAPWSTRAISTGPTAGSKGIAEPSEAYHGLAFHETFGVYGYLMKLRAETLRDLGAAMSPFNAFLFAQGIETLPLRMRQHVGNAAAVAEHLSQHGRCRPLFE